MLVFFSLSLWRAGDSIIGLPLAISYHTFQAFVSGKMGPKMQSDHVKGYIVGFVQFLFEDTSLNSCPS